MPGSLHDYKENQDYIADPHWPAGIAGFRCDPPGLLKDEVVATGAGDHSAVGISLLVPLTLMIILSVGIPVGPTGPDDHSVRNHSGSGPMILIRR